MFWEADNERDRRKQQFIELMKKNKCRQLVDHLSDRMIAFEEGEIDAAVLFQTAGSISKKGSTILSDFKKRPDVILAGIAMDEDRYLTGIGEIGVSVRKAPLAEIFADIIISPCSGDGSARSRTASKVLEAGGGAVTDELASLAPVAAGAAVSTGPGELPVSAIIHVNTADIAPDTEKLRKALLSALGLAESLEAQTVVCPSFSGEAGKIAPGDAATAVIEAIKNHPAESITKIIIADEDEEAVSVLTAALEKFDEEE
ncbi:MAG: macro domain-containing protein [Candidatus Krumholzibacteriota bacterium]|nr:macro domain-containing protein [Candidatus Krumholzibacteriota bacterium]